MDTVMDDRMQTAAHLEAATETKTAPVEGARKGSRSRVLTYAGWGPWRWQRPARSAFVYYDGRVSTDDAQVDAHIAPIAPKVAGNIAEILVDDNQPVKAGQVLLRIDLARYEAKVAQARAALAAAESQAAGANAGVPLTTPRRRVPPRPPRRSWPAATADLTKARDRPRPRLVIRAGPTRRPTVDAKRASAERASADLERMRPPGGGRRDHAAAVRRLRGRVEGGRPATSGPRKKNC
jgi:membrane fusion protein (multidrug efflux system)